jgi:DNA-binding MarR family transcriptional regulator
MIIHDKEIGFLYTVGAFCDYNDYVVAHPDVSVATANLYKAEVMSKAYAAQHPEAQPITVSELRDLLVYELEDVVKAVNEAEKAGTTRKVETADTGKKRAKSS